ncbi:MAG: NosD domain-containing protein [Thermoplasmata archaeon]
MAEADMRIRSFVVAFILFLGLLFPTLMILPVNVSGTTLYVGGAGSGNYTTIQGAIDDASPGDTVHVFSGVYYENVIVNKTMSLVGAGRDTTIIDGNDTGIMVHVSADWVNISGFTVQNGGQSLGLPLHFRGIWLDYAQNCSVTDNNISNNEDGLLLSTANGTTITGNVISSNHKDGITIMFSNNNTVVNNTVMRNWELGILLYDSANNTLADNNVSNNHDAVGLLYSSGNTIKENTFSDHLQGVSLWDSDNNSVYHNNFINNFINNSQHAHDDTGANEWDDGYPNGGNYWSDYSGVDNCSGQNQTDCPDPDGIGDTVYSIELDNQDNYPLMEPLPVGGHPLGNQRPVCDITHPEELARIHETYSITGTANDEDGTIVTVEISIDDGPWIQVNGTASWSYEWDTTEVDNGEYTIRARCLDEKGAYDVVSVVVDVHNPTEEEMMYGEIFFWTAVVLVAVIAITGLVLEVVRRKKEES